MHFGARTRGQVRSLCRGKNCLKDILKVIGRGQAERGQASRDVSPADNGGHRRTKAESAAFVIREQNPAHIVLYFQHVSWRPLSPQLHPWERPGGLHDLEMIK